MRRQGGTLTIRRWLALALAVTFFVPAITTVIVGVTQFGGTWHAGSEASQLLRAGAAQWTDPTWQAATRRTLTLEGVDFVLVEDGRTIYQSSSDPLAGTDTNNQRTAQQLVIPGKPRRMAYIYSSRFGWGGAGGSFWLVPVAGLTTLLVTLGAIAWFLGRTLIRPLAATSNATRQVAAGNLNVKLPASRVREVAELNAAFLTMSAELRASLQHQAAVDEERRLFVSAIAHDLRTPLFSLRGHLEGLEQGLATTPQKLAQYIHICREKADALERLIADLFAFARIEYLEQTLQRDRLELGELLGNVVEGRRREADGKGVTLELAGPAQLCVVEGDEHLLGRAVENMLDNALRYTPPGGRIAVEWRLNADRAVFTVADTGPGIPSHDLPRVFEPMYRADPSRSRETGGTGLGLAIARRIIRAHGGDLVAANRSIIGQPGPSRGAEFTGSIPLISQRNVPERSPSVPESKDRSAAPAGPSEPSVYRVIR